MEEVVVTKVVHLIKPLFSHIPMGLYEVEYENSECYIINGFFHNKNRFIDPSSLILELF